MIPIVHILWALGFNLTIGFTTGNWWAGAAAGSFFYLGREYTQAEYRWIERFGFGKRSNMPWYGPFQLRVWDLHSVLDFVIPSIIMVAVAMSKRFW